MRFFKLGDVDVPLESVLQFEQTYDYVSDNNVIRMANADGICLFNPLTEKIKTTISGSGWVVPALNGINYRGVLTLKCAAPLGIDGATVTIPLPAARRMDSGFEPYGYALMPDGSEVDTSINIVGDIATLGAVAGAARYNVKYFPEIQVITTKKPRNSSNVSRAEHRWSAEFEEV